MMKNNLQAKRIVITAGEVQLPIKVGGEVCYRYDGHLMWTDRVQDVYKRQLQKMPERKELK